MNDEPVYGLSIRGTFGELVVYGPLSSMRQAFNGWRDGQFGPVSRFTVEGFTNTADRAMHHVCIDSSEIQAMSLVLEF